MTLWAALATAIGTIVLLWVVLIIALALARPQRSVLPEALRLLPDLLRLLRNLATDRALPRGVRIRLGLLIAYLAMPVDLIPDFVPVLGYADDLIIAALVLRSVVRRAGLDVVERHWTGTPQGFAAVCRVTGLTK